MSDHENLLHYCAVLFTKICSYAGIKFSFAVVLSLLSFFFDSVHQDALLAVFFLILFDTVSGIYASAVSGEEIRSAKIFRTAIKISAYFLLISSGFLAERATSFPFLDETIIAFLGVTELKSILENAAKAGYAVPSGLIQKLREFLGAKKK